MNRRTFVGLSCATAIAGLLTACAPQAPAAIPPAASTPAPAATSAAATKPAAARSNVPTYIPAQGPKADYPSSDKGVENGYVRFPQQLSKSVAETPASGGDVSGMVLVANPALPGIVNSGE